MATLNNPALLVIGKGCSFPDPSLFRRMGPLVDAQTDASLMARFGISYHTWRKLRAGEPVRLSLIKRLETRVAVLEAEVRNKRPAQMYSGAGLGA